MSHLKFVNETLMEPAACDYKTLCGACCKLLFIRVL